eukprot:Opistho-2@9715
MNAFIDIAEEQQALELAAYMSTLSEALSGLEQQSKALIAEGNFSALLTRFVENGAVLFTPAGDKEVEGPINTLTCLVRKAKAEDAVALYKGLGRIISSNTSDRPLMRLKLLTNLFNNVGAQSSARYDIYYSLIELAGACGRVDAILSEFSELSRWLDEWHATNEQRRVLFKLINKVLTANNRPTEAQEFLVKFLSTYEKTDDVKSVRAEAVACVVAAIADPAAFQLEGVLAIPAVAQLEGDIVHKLLGIFVSEGIDAYEQLHAENADAIAKLGLSHDDCRDKMRLLTLASIASEVSELKYATVAETMRIGREDVEEWIIKAIGSGLLEARLDQLNERVLISRSTHRTFSKAQWTYVKQRLGAWQTAMVDVFQVIRNARSQAHAALAKQQAGSA